MLLFLLGLILFFGFHLLPFFPEYRQRLIDVFESDTIVGESLYKIVFVVASLVGIFFIGIGKAYIDSVSLWPTPHVFRLISLIVMFPAFLLIASAYLPHSFKHVIPHPMLSGVILWSATHLIVNGDLASIIMFGCFLGYSIFAITHSTPRAKDDAAADDDEDDDDDDDEEEVAARKKKVLIENATVVGVAVFAFLFFWVLHESIFDIPVFPG